MDEQLKKFLTESPLAAKIKLPTTVVVERTELSLQDVANIRSAGAYGPIPKKGEICELHIGGQRIALGRIVRRRGEYYFKVSRPAAPENEKEVSS